MNMIFQDQLQEVIWNLQSFRGELLELLDVYDRGAVLDDIDELKNDIRALLSEKFGE